MSDTKPQSKPTLDQRRARHAWDAVRAAKNKTGPHAKQEPKKFGGQARKLPSRIMTAGLGQALAFLQAKGYAPGLLAEISDWVLVKRRACQEQTGDLLQDIIHGDAAFLRRATDETLAYLLWLNRFAEAEGLTEENDE